MKERFCYYHPNIESRFICDSCARNLCLTDKKSIAHNFIIGAGSNAKTYTDVMHFCPVCEIDQRIKRAKKEERWLAIILTITYFSPWIILLSVIELIGLYALFSLLLDPTNTYNQLGNAIVAIPLLTALLSLFGVFGPFLIWKILTGLYYRIKHVNSKTRLKLLDEQKHITSTFAIPNHDVNEKNFLCEFHGNLKAVESCHICHRLICEDDKILYLTNKSVPVKYKKSKDIREAFVCPLCNIDLKISNKRKSWTNFGFITVISVLFIWAGLLLFYMGIQLNNNTFFVSILYAIIPGVILAKMVKDRFESNSNIKKLEEEKLFITKSMVNGK